MKLTDLHKKIKLGRSPLVYQVKRDVLLSCDDNFIVRVNTQHLKQDYLDDVIELGEHPLVDSYGPATPQDGVELTKQQSVAIQEAWNIPNKLRRKCTAYYATVDGFGFWVPDSAPWVVIRRLNNQSHHPLMLLSDEKLNKDIIMLDPESKSDMQDLNHRFQRFGGRESISLDIETFGWDENNKEGLNPFKGDIRMIQIHFERSDECFVIDFGPRWARKDYEYAKKVLKFNIDKGVELLGQNFQFDMLWLTVKFDVNFGLCTIRDSMLASKIIWSGIKLYRHNLAAIAKRVNIACHDKALQKADFGGFLLPAHYNYGAGDVWTTRKVIEKLEKLYPTEHETVRQACRLSRVIVHMNASGYPVNSVLIEKDVIAKSNKADKLKAEIELELGMKNATSSSELLEKLNSMGIEVESTEAADLRAIDHPVVDKVREMRGLYLTANYGKALLQSIAGDPYHAYTNYQTVNPQASGRPAAGKYVTGKGVDFGFNGLNMSKENNEFEDVGDIRVWFQAPPGRKVSECDLKGAHLAISLELSGQKDVQKDMNESDDGHAVTTTVIVEEVLGADHPLANLDNYFSAREKKDPLVTDMRNLAKNGIYSIINICSAKSLKHTLAKKGIFVLDEVAEAVVTALRRRVPKVIEYVSNKAWGSIRGRSIVDPTIHAKPMDDPKKLKKKIEDIRKYNVGLPKYKQKNMKPIKHVRVYGPTGRYRYLPVFQKYSEKSGKIYESISHAATAGCIWPTMESHIMSEALIRFYEDWIVAKPWLGIKINAWIYDAICIEADELDIDVATQALMDIINEEWDKWMPGIPGVTGDAQEHIGNNWSEIS